MSAEVRKTLADEVRAIFPNADPIVWIDPDLIRIEVAKVDEQQCVKLGDAGLSISNILPLKNGDGVFVDIIRYPRVA